MKFDITVTLEEVNPATQDTEFMKLKSTDLGKEFVLVDVNGNMVAIKMDTLKKALDEVLKFNSLYKEDDKKEEPAVGN